MSVTYTIRAGEMGQWAKALAAKLQPTVRASLRRSGARALTELRDAARAYPIRATGEVVRSYRALMPAWNELNLVNVAPHAQFVETGRRAGARMPPVMALIPWVRLVIGPPEAHVRSIAWLVARAISRRGIPARPVLSDPKLMGRINKGVADALRKDLNEAVAKELSKLRGRQ